MNKIHGKIIEDPAVYVLPLENRKKISNKDKSPNKDDRSISNPKSR